MHRLYVEFEPFDAQCLYFREHIQASELPSLATRFIKLFDKNTTEVQFNNLKIQLAELITDFYKDFNIDIDKEIFKELSVISKENGEILRFIDFPDKNFDIYVDEIYEKSIFSNENRLLTELQKLKFGKKNKIESDQLFNYAKIANSFL
jgi:hypothetical protein